MCKTCLLEGASPPGAYSFGSNHQVMFMCVAMEYMELSAKLLPRKQAFWGTITHKSRRGNWEMLVAGLEESH